jgi:hypothetical protein
MIHKLVHGRIELKLCKQVVFARQGRIRNYLSKSLHLSQQDVNDTTRSLGGEFIKFQFPPPAHPPSPHRGAVL